MQLVQEIQSLGFVIERVLADSLYGESGAVICTLEKLRLPYIVAIRFLHGVLMAKGQRVRYNRWHAYDQPLSEHPSERRYIRSYYLWTPSHPCDTTKSPKEALKSRTKQIVGSS